MKSRFERVLLRGELVPLLILLSLPLFWGYLRATWRPAEPPEPVFGQVR